MKHYPPLGGIEYGHHVLDFNYYYQHEQSFRETMQKRKLLFKRGKYAELSNYFTSFNWEKNLMDLDAKQAYKKWLDIYHVGCGKFIPMGSWMTKELRELIGLKKCLWYK